MHTTRIEPSPQSGIHRIDPGAPEPSITVDPLRIVRRPRAGMHLIARPPDGGGSGDLIASITPLNTIDGVLQPRQHVCAITATLSFWLKSWLRWRRGCLCWQAKRIALRRLRDIMVWHGCWGVVMIG